MSDYRQSIRNYIRAAEAVLEIKDLTDEEEEVVSEMQDRLGKY